STITSYVIAAPISAPRSALFPTRRSSDLFRAADGDFLVDMSSRKTMKCSCFAFGAMLMVASFTAATISIAPNAKQEHFIVFRERSEEHTSELQSPYDLVCRLLLEKKKQHK